MSLALNNFQLKILAHNQKALHYQKTHRLDNAITELQKAIKLSPQNPMLHHNLAGIYREQGNIERSIDSYTHALKISETAISNSNLGSLYFEINQLDLALSHYLKSYMLEPKNIEHSYLLGHIYTKTNQLKIALKYYKNVYKINPHYKLIGACLFISKRKLCSWSGLLKISKILDKNNQEDPFGSLIRTENPYLNLLSAKIEASNIRSRLSKLPFKKHKIYHHPKIRLGYISGNFADHPVGYMTQTLYKLHDRNKFDIYTYAYGADDHSHYRQDITKLSDQFRDLNSLSDHQAANQIYKDEIDLLIDLTGPTEGHRLGICAYRPARIQLTWAGLLGSTGSHFFDYTIVDKIVVPKLEQKFFTEKLLYLSPSYYLSKEYAPPVKKYTRADFGLPTHQFVFACFNQMYKISPQIWKVWMEILKQVPSSVLWLWEQNGIAKNNLIKSAHKLGIKSNRLVFTPTMSSQDYSDRLRLADLALDTPIYGGGATTYLSLMGGVPVITLYGKHLASRLTSSILTQSNLTQLIARDLEEYQALAINIARDKSLHNNLKLQLTPAKLNKTLFNYLPKILELETLFTSLVTGSTIKKYE